MTNLLLKNYLLISGYFFVSLTTLSAQDLIVTQENDSLNCKITSENEEYIYFTYKQDADFRKTMMPKNLVKSYKYKFFQEVEVPQTYAGANEIYPRARVGFYGGWSNRFARIPDNVPTEIADYLSESKSGFHYGGDIALYFSENSGFGLRYSAYNSDHQIDIFLENEDGTTMTGILRDDIAIHFIGPFYSARFFNLNKRNCLVMNFGVGYLGYLNDGMLIDPLLLKGNTLGFSWDFAYDNRIAENLALGLQVSFVLGTLREYEITYLSRTETIELDKDNYDNISRIDLSLGLRFVK